MRRWRRLWCGLVVVVVTWGAAGCGTGSQAPPHGNVAAYGAPGEPDSLDPAVGVSGFDLYDQPLLFDTLLDTDPRTLALRPMLATSWEFLGPEKRTFRLHLRPGVAQ